MKKLILICLFLIIKNSYAITIPEAYVFSEEDGPECNISNASSVAAVESVLRQNRIKIGNKKLGFSFYINTNALTVNGGCVTHTSLMVRTIQEVKIRQLKNKAIFSEVLLCNRGTLFTGPLSGLESRINEAQRSFAEQCISEIEKIEFVE